MRGENVDIKDYEQDITQYAVEITKYLISHGSRLQDAEDTAHDTIVKMLELDIFVAPDKIRSWMYRVSIRNYINKYHRNHHYQTIIEQLKHELSDYAPPGATTDLTELLHQLKLSDERLLWSYYYENCSTKQLSKQLNISLSKVKIDLYRARKKFKKILEKEGYDEWKI